MSLEKVGIGAIVAVCIFFAWAIVNNANQREEFYYECIESGMHTSYECKALSTEAYPT